MSSPTPEPGKRPGEGDTVATLKALEPVVRYRPFMLAPDVEADIDELPLWAGQGVGLAHKVQPAAETLRESYDEASSILKRLAAISVK